MSRLTRSPKRDANEPAICEALTKAGCAVIKHSGTGAPDLIVFRQRAFLALVEVKRKGGTLTPAQVKWRQTWTGPAPVRLETVADALALVRETTDPQGTSPRVGHAASRSDGVRPTPQSGRRAL